GEVGVPAGDQSTDALWNVGQLTLRRRLYGPHVGDFTEGLCSLRPGQRCRPQAVVGEHEAHPAQVCLAEMKHQSRHMLLRSVVAPLIRLRLLPAQGSFDTSQAGRMAGERELALCKAVSTSRTTPVRAI